MNDSSIAVISIAPNMRGYLGHCFNYQQSVENAATINGWTYRVAIPEDCQIESKREAWNKCLLPKASEALLGKVKSFLPYARRVHTYLAKEALTFRGSKKILFLESFYPLQLSVILFATAFVSRRNTAVWLLYRHSVVELMSSELLNKLLVRAFCRLFGGRVCLLTDSELLRTPLGEFFGRTVNVLPIPHTGASGERIAARRNDDRLVIWWPGEPRPSKGLDTVRELLALPTASGAKMRFILSEDTPVDLRDTSCEVVRVDAHLTPSKYEELLATSDIILLPYDRDLYSEGTSGIFVESIVAGKLPLVTLGTWMEYELQKYNLPELATSWDDIGGFGAWAEKMYRSRGVRAKLANMRESYLQFHNEKSFAKAMLALSTKSVDDPVR